MLNYDYKTKTKEVLSRHSLNGIKILLGLNLAILCGGLIAIIVSHTVVSVQLFIGAVICTMAMTLLMIIAVTLAPVSRVQVSTLFFLIFNYLYLFGVILEVTTSDLEAICVAIKIEYFSFAAAILGLTWFISNLINIKIPTIIYAVQFIASLLMVGVIWTIGKNQLFYRSLTLDLSGEYPRIVLENGPFFYIFYGYISVFVIGLLGMCCYRLHKSNNLNKIRIRYVICGILCPWLNMIIRYLGVSKGYDISYLGILGEVVCFFFAFIKYGYFNSIQAANENILKYAHAGILVLDDERQFIFQNDLFKDVITALQKEKDLDEKEIIDRAISEKSILCECQDKTYEITAEELIECGYNQGYMLWVNDITEHYAYMEQMRKLATTDGLTGLNNRSAYQKKLTTYMQEEGSGAFIMMDIDNFKQINDTYGHATGDAVLQKLGSVISEAIGSKHYACRIGGDEFAVFFQEITGQEELSQKVRTMMDEFQAILLQTKLPESFVSFGISILSSADEKKDFARLYREADRALYLSKNNGKNRHCFYGQG